MPRHSSRKVNVVLATMAVAASTACSGADATHTVLQPSPPAPNVTSICPNGGVAGGPFFWLTVLGTYFDATSTVNFGGATYPTYFVNTTEVDAAIPASAIASIGAMPVTVTNAATSANSNELTFTIGAAVEGSFTDCWASG